MRLRVTPRFGTKFTKVNVDKGECVGYNLTMANYNGHKNWNHWNVALWLFSDEGLYATVYTRCRNASSKDEAAKAILADLTCLGIESTPDGAPYTYTTVRAALRGYDV